MPIVNIDLLEGRSPDALAALIREVTSAVSRALGRPEESVRVLVREVPAHLWGVGGTAAAARGAALDEVVRGSREPG